MNKNVSVVIPNYNGRKLLEKNIPLVIKALEKADLSYEIIVPDDASTDNSVPFLKSKYPSVSVLESKVNGGFAVNVNKGVFAAKNDLVFILNSDVEVSEEYFLHQLSYFEKADTFGVQGRIIGIDSDEIQDAGKYPSIFGLKINTTQNFLSGIKNHETPTFFLSGANALVDRKKLIALGGLCELYSPFYGEDADLCLRAWRNGWRSYYEHKSICRHPASTTIAAYNKRKKIRIISYRNRLIMHYLHFDGVQLFCWYLKLFVEIMLKAFAFRVTFFEGLFQFVKMFGKVKEYKRKNILNRNLKRLDVVIDHLQKEIDKLKPQKF